jgi:hypothetical protein
VLLQSQFNWRQGGAGGCLVSVTAHFGRVTSLLSVTRAVFADEESQPSEIGAQVVERGRPTDPADCGFASHPRLASFERKLRRRGASARPDNVVAARLSRDR